MPPASSGAALLAPSLPDLRPPAVEPRLEPQHGAEHALVDQPPDRQEVAVPAAVLEHGQRDAPAAGLLDDLAPLGGRRGQRLVDDDGQPRLDTASRAIGDVRPVRCRDHDQVDLAGTDQLVGAVEQRRARVVAEHLRAPVRVRGHDRGQPEALRRGDQGSVEDAPGQPVAEQAHAQRRPVRAHVPPPSVGAGPSDGARGRPRHGHCTRRGQTVAAAARARLSGVTDALMRTEIDPTET